MNDATSKERTKNESKERLRPAYSVKWIRIHTLFGHSLLVATFTYPLDDANEPTPKTRVLSKVFADCVEDVLSRFIFWLTADLNIDHLDLDKETRNAVRRELSTIVKPLTALQVAQMNARVNSLPDYLRVFYLEDYFESLGKMHNKDYF